MSLPISIALTVGLCSSSPDSLLATLLYKKPIKASRNKIASTVEKWPSCKAKYIRKADPNNKGMSTSHMSKSNLKDLPTKAVNPNTKRIFVILDPTTFPTTISVVPLNTEAMDAANSGNEVPKATIVTPMIKGDIPKDNPIFSAESINQSEATNNTARLAAAIRMKVIKIC